jgi:DNA adenine methylase
MTRSPARPVLKWAGGKSRSLPDILTRFPDRIETYYEPFVGGGAVFFALAAAERFGQAVLADRNADHIAVYRSLKKDAQAVIRALGRFRYDEDEYYRVRELDPAELETAESAARTIFLNKTGYNGLYRVNSKGKFNVPFGRYKAPRFCDPDNLKAAAAALRKAELVVGDFADVCTEAKRGDAVYFDPPYDPISKTSNFTAYHKEEFGPQQHKRLAKLATGLARRKVTIVLSNSATPFTRSLYRGLSVNEIAVSRPINSKASARGAVYELLVTNRLRQ